jgi:hypothetical protein
MDSLAPESLCRTSSAQSVLSQKQGGSPRMLERKRGIYICIYMYKYNKQAVLGCWKEREVAIMRVYTCIHIYMHIYIYIYIYEFIYIHIGQS